MKKQYITMKVVAEELKLSPSTVSRVLNKRPDVSQETRERVLKKIAELGYVRNATATMMRNKMSLTIGVIFEADFDPFFSEILQGIEKGASKYDYRMILMNAKLREEEAKTIVTTLLEHRVDGIIIVPSSSDVSYIRDLAKKRFPIVVIGRNFEDLEVDEVYTDDFVGGQLAGEYLISRGKSNLLMINSPHAGSASVDRERGFIEAATRRNLNYRVINDRATDYDSTFNIIRSIYCEQKTPPFDGIFCFNDTRAFATINALRNIDTSLLKRISIVGYDDILFSSIFSPKLTTIHIDKEREGYEAVKMLTQRIKGKRKFSKKFILQVSLLVRET